MSLLAYSHLKKPFDNISMGLQLFCLCLLAETKWTGFNQIHDINPELLLTVQEGLSSGL